MSTTPSHRWLDILEHLQDGLLVITASNRQADFLRQQYRYFQSEKNQQQGAVWHSPAIITNKQWLVSLYQHLMILHGEENFPWALLSEQESRMLWEQIIENDGDYLLDTRRTAERVRQAANRLEQWLMSGDIALDDSYNWREETRRFKYWQQLAQQQCEDNFWIESYQLDRWINDRITQLIGKTNSNLLPKKIGFVGFQQPSPAREQLLSTLKTSGISLLTLEPALIEAEIYRYEFADNREEIKQAAVWAKKQWSADPEQRLGIVLPNLNKDRELTRIIFERTFCPSQLFKSDDESQRPFDISLGLPLSSYPLIDSAMMIMSLLSKPLPQEQLIQLLVSPYITSIEQQPLIISIVSLIRKSRQPKISVKDVAFFASHYEEKSPSIETFLEQLNAFESTGNLLASQWSLVFADLLENMQWCGHRKLSSSEYQTKEAWNKNIDQMAIYDHMSGLISWSKFQTLFSRAIRETLFQPQSGDCPIQIMGILEAAFLTFDKIRICGVDNRLWPDSAKPSPFIPYELQRQYDMPNATAERELRVSGQLKTLFCGAAETVIFSHSRGNGEESLGVSPLLEGIELRETNEQFDYQTPAQKINIFGTNVEYLNDNFAPKLEGESVSGGSKLLQDIARCQFRAFAHHRLNANEAESPREDIDPLDRGNLVHQILEHCWLQLFDKKQSNLQQLHHAQQLADAIDPFIEQALINLQQQRQTPLTDAIIRLEHKRLKKLLLQWFNLEIARPKFTVKELEQKVNAPIAGNTIRLQLDRVDELEDGSLAIIDYKTGKVNRKNWFGDRPDEPQLPLYAMVLAEQKQTIGALLYGQVKTAENRFTGVADNRSLVSGVAKDFSSDSLDTEAESLSEQVIKWREDLHALMAEYISGESAVSPREDDVCQYCDLHGLCRIGEMSQRSSRTNK